MARPRAVPTTTATGATAAVAALVLLSTFSTPATSSTPAAGAASAALVGGVVTRSADIGYQNCPAPDVRLSASIGRQPFSRGQLVTYTVTVHNLTHRTCGWETGTLQPTAPSAPVPPLGLLGPCGQIPVVIDDAAGTDVYPGPGPVGCPMLLGPRLAAGQSTTATGMWDQSAGLGRGIPGSLPPGRYRLVIDRKVTLPVVLTGAIVPSPGSDVPGPSALTTTTSSARP